MSIIIHGGAGNGSKKILNILKHKYGDLEKQYNDSLHNIVAHGLNLIKKGECASNIVVECVKLLEDDKLFNAGVGATRNVYGDIFHEACIVDGKTKNWGAVGDINIIKNPIELSHKIMLTKSQLIVGNTNIHKYTEPINYPIVDSNVFFTQFREDLDKISDDMGTVGVVIRDMTGNIAAGTSTGGLSKKIGGRLGDTHANGSSTIADNNYCGISVTGHGEYIIKEHIASQVLYSMKFGNYTLNESIDNAIDSITPNNCGIVGIDNDGKIYAKCNTERFYHAYSTITDDKIHVELWNSI